MEAQAIVSYVLPGLVLVLGGACGALIYRRRAMFPVDGRDIGLVLLSVARSHVLCSTVHGVQ